MLRPVGEKPACLELAGRRLSLSASVEAGGLSNSYSPTRFDIVQYIPFMVLSPVTGLLAPQRGPYLAPAKMDQDNRTSEPVRGQALCS